MSKFHQTTFEDPYENETNEPSQISCGTQGWIQVKCQYWAEEAASLANENWTRGFPLREMEPVHHCLEDS